MFKYLIYFGFILTDLLLYGILNFSDFGKQSEETAVISINNDTIFSIISDPVFWGCIGLSFISFRKANYTQACAVSAIPIIISLIYYLIFHQ